MMDGTRPGARETGAEEGFQTSMVHLYRGEMNRLTVWRQRLDVTSNWAMLLTLGLTTFTLGDPRVPHFILLLGLALIAISVLIEGRRYRHLHHAEWRVWLLEAGYFADRLSPGSGISGWRRSLAQDLAEPRLQLSLSCAVRVRLRANYLLLLYLVTAVWLAKLFIHPGSPATAAELWSRLAVGELFPSWLVAVTAVAFVAGASWAGLSCPPADEVERFRREGPGASPAGSAHGQRGTAAG